MSKFKVGDVLYFKTVPAYKYTVISFDEKEEAYTILKHSDNKETTQSKGYVEKVLAKLTKLEKALK